jgi:ELP3 family radical SAM enzyme/protein acetyltransferase
MDMIDHIYRQKVESFIKEFATFDFETRDIYQKKFIILRKKYKINPKKTLILKIYRKLVDDKVILPNHQFYKFSIKKIGKSSSGVSVITVLTSPEPQYTNMDGIKVKQTFSCGENCSYCPNEPEEKYDLQITDINVKDNFINVYSRDKLNTTRVLSYIIHNDITYDVQECRNLSDDTMIIMFADEFSIVDEFSIDDKLIGIKVAQPRSYLSAEPAVLRANRNDFDAIKQFNDRADALSMCGHPIDKIEIIILGGTWDHYPKEYRYEFIRDTYYAANIYGGIIRNKSDLKDEITINETAEHRIIGLTIETRPDCVDLKTILTYRELNVTRVQIGVQHIDDTILKNINRNCYTADTIESTNLLKQNGYKVDWHLMPDLPTSSYEIDLQMINDLFHIKNKHIINDTHTIYELSKPELQADQLKIYPCTTVDWTDIKKWYDEGFYKPYSEDEELLIRLIVKIKQSVFPWQRLNRIIRDIPNLYILGGNKNINLRQKVLRQMKDDNYTCKCIRCAEVKDRNFDIDNAKLFIDQYNGLNSIEYFISYRSPCKNILYGFIRLRINLNNDNLVYDSLRDSSLVRELHVYGKLIHHSDKGLQNGGHGVHGGQDSVQHKGLGKKLLCKAEEITLMHNIYNVAIISGVGVREYYLKNGYTLKDNYMMKKLYKYDYYIEYLSEYLIEYLIVFSILILCISIFLD